jgi:ABC-type multidrug transport system ATPase subunit/ABC-type multidrug transport system permease subunit
MEISIKAKAD